MTTTSTEIHLDELDIHISEFANREIEENTKAKHYVDNDEIYEEFKVWIPKCIEAKKQGKDRPQIPNKIAIAINDICNNLTRKSCYFQYTQSWKENMVGDAIIACVKYIHNFDPVKFNKPFAYISWIAKQAFNKRIQIEEKEHYFKLKTFSEHGGFSMFEGEEDEVNMGEMSVYEDYHTKIAKFETKMDTKRQVKKDKQQANKPALLADFMG